MASQSEPLDAATWKPRSALIGTLLANRYKITALVGQGSTGAVFRADDVLSGKPVAVRVLVPALAQTPGLVPRIRARVDRNLAIHERNPAALVNLVDIFDAGMTLEGELFVVSDFLDGDHLATMLTRGGRLPWGRARSLLIRLCQIVHGLHQEGIVLGVLEARHCFALRGKNKHEALKVINNAVIEHLAGTIGPRAGHGAAALARYIAPEQACGEASDARSDVYSFGIIAYELLTGTVPFTDANPVRLVSMHLQRPPRPPRELDADIPADVEVALLRSLAKDPADRFQTMDAFAAALTAVPESSQPAGSLAIVSASLAASEIPVAPAHDHSSASAPAAVTAPPASVPPEPVAAALSASPIPATPAPVAATPSASPVPTTPAPVAATSTSPVPVTVDVPALATNVPTPGQRVPSIPTHVTLPPGSMSSDVIRGVASPPTRPNPQARPATLPPTLGGLRLPPPPTLGRPATIPPGGLNLPPPPTLGAPIAAPRAPSTASPAAAPLGSVPLPTPRAPSAALPAGALLRAGIAPTTEAAPVPTDSKPVPTDSPPTSDAATPVPADSLPVPADSPPVPADSPPAAVQPPVAATPSKPTEEPRAAASTSSARRPVIATEEPRAASSASSARRPVIILTEVRKEGDSASASGTYLRNALADAAPAAASAEKTSAEQTKAEPAAEKPRLVPAARPSDELLRSAALQQRQVTGPQAALSQVSGTTDSLVAEVPRSRAGLWVVLGLAAAAGIAVLMFARPGTPNTPTPAAENPIASAPTKLPTKLADATPPAPADDPPPDRGLGLVDPPAPAEPSAPAVDPPPEPQPVEPAPDKPGKKDPKKKKTRVREVPEEEREKDVFDQLREHMAAKKAAEEAAKKAASAPAAPVPAPAPAPASKPEASDANKAGETLDRAKQAAANGNHTLAYSLAKQSNSMTRTPEAQELMGVSACRLKNIDNARAVLGSLSGARRDSVVAACKQAGLTL